MGCSSTAKAYIEAPGLKLQRMDKLDSHAYGAFGSESIFLSFVTQSGFLHCYLIFIATNVFGKRRSKPAIDFTVLAMCLVLGVVLDPKSLAPFALFCRRGQFGRTQRQSYASDFEYMPFQSRQRFGMFAWHNTIRVRGLYVLFRAVRMVCHWRFRTNKDRPILLSVLAIILLVRHFQDLWLLGLWDATHDVITMNSPSVMAAKLSLCVGLYFTYREYFPSL
jgi:hypothetical protein